MAMYINSNDPNLPAAVKAAIAKDDAARKARTTRDAVLEGVVGNTSKRKRPIAPPGNGGNKYHAIKTTVDGITFDSKAEADHYGTIKALMIAGKVMWFCRQPRFLLPGGIEYRADFIVGYTKDGPGFKVLSRIEIQDVKGFLTPEYRLKKKLMLATYGIEIVEVRQ